MAKHFKNVVNQVASNKAVESKPVPIINDYFFEEGGIIHPGETKNLQIELKNIGNDIGEINVIDLVNTVEKVIGRKIKYELTSYPEEYPSDQPQRRCPDISKAKNNLGYLPTTNLETGLDNHFEWFRKFKNS